MGRTATWRTAIEGTDTAYVTYQPDLAVPGVASTIKAFYASQRKPE